ncbi:hypothetical protein AKJ09_06019 [Labilithrix luteola]|uniref:Uncharacterized protein n=1 Tax=Labilithrix luteola TaxID=1391654 RepID=A0A0K1Q0P7_9BACT|nr:hypothetical protein AKJ09_06019 [Labilithrix luteola]
MLYGGAHLYKADAAAKLGKLAANAMATWGKDDDAFGALVGAGKEGSIVAARVREKLANAPLEAMCIDFEDGYGPRPDAEEDADAERAATELAKASQAPGPVVGMRIKALSTATARRAIRTLDLFVTTLAKASSAALPLGFTVTLPKVEAPNEVAALASLLDDLERENGLAPKTIGIELMVESPKSLVAKDGSVALPALVTAANGRCVAAHLGAYDLTASLGVSATEQRLDHPACDAARMLMQLSLGDGPVAVVDGATTILPLPRHKAAAGQSLDPRQAAENESDVHGAWRLHARHVRSALAMGIYQGWDLHPAQLPARYGALYAFFLGERNAMSARLRTFVDRATKATRSGQVFDDAATGQGLLNFFLRGVACGALDENDVQPTGLSLDELRSRSFAAIVEARST